MRSRRRPSPTPPAEAWDGAAARLPDRRRLRRGGGDRRQGRQRAGARLPARAAGADRRLRRLLRRHRRARPRAGADLVLDLPRGGKIAAQNAAAERASRGDPRLLRRQQRLGARRPAPPGRALRRPRGRLRLRPGPLPRRRAATTSRAPTGATRWRCARWSRRWPASPPATARSTRCAATPTCRSPPSGSHDLSFPFALAKRGLRSLYVPWARAEEKMVPTLEGEFARKRRMMVGLWDIVVGEGMLSPARLLAALRLRARLAPAAALPDPVPAPRRLRRQRRPARPAAGSTRRPSRSRLALLAAALLGRRCRSRPLRVARYYVMTTASIAAGLWDRARHGAPGAWEKAEGTGSDAAAPSTSLIAPARPGRPLAAAAGRRDRDQARQPRPGHLPPAPGRPGRPRVRDAEAAHDGRRAPTRSGSAPSSPATTRASPRAGRFLRRTSLDEIPNLVNVLRGEMAIVGPRPTIPAQVDDYTPFQHRRHEVRPGSPAGRRSRAAPASPGRSGSSSTSGTSTTAAPPSTSASSPRPSGCSSPATASPRTEGSTKTRRAAWATIREVIGFRVTDAEVSLRRSSPAMPPRCTAGSTTPRRRRR